MNKKTILDICQTVGGALVLSVFGTMIWLIWSQERIAIQFLLTELVLALLIYTVEKSLTQK